MQRTTNLQGAIGFSKYKGKGISGWISNAIRWFTEGKFSHTFIVVEHSVFGVLIMEANGKEVIITRLSKYFEKGYEFELWKCNVEPSRINRSLDYISKNFLEKCYGWLQCIGFIFVWFGKKVLLKKMNNPFGSGIICSELVLKYMQSLGVDEALGLDRNNTTPEDIYELVTASDKFTKVSLP